MKANEFFREYGLVESKKHLEWMARVGARRDIHGWLMDDLKRLIESHELVEYMGGIDKAKEQAYVLAMEVGGFNPTKIAQAIQDVESYQ